MPRSHISHGPVSAGARARSKGAPDRAAVNARIASVTGILFAGLFSAALVLVRQAPGLAAPDSVYTDFYSKGSGNVLVTVGLYIVPFAGIAFMWHMSATRIVIEALPGPASEMPRWLQLTSGVLFVCMLFAGTSAVGAVALLTVRSSVALPPPDVARALTSVGYGMVFVFGVRAAGMFMITTTTLTVKRALLPRWVALLGYLAAAFLLLRTTFHPAILLVFPGWVVVFSVCLLRSPGRSSQAASSRSTPRPEPSASTVATTAEELP
jgi:hypothetical protein